MDLSTLTPDILAWPFAAGLAVLATHVPLGRRVLARGIVFLDLAVAQIAVLGVIVAHSLGWESAWQTQLAAGSAALAGATLLAAFEARWPDIQEALIGSSFVVSASLAVLLLSGDPHGGEHMAELLTGQILWANPHEIAAIAALNALLLGFWAWRGSRLSARSFYLLFALAITASVQLVGVYLVFASLILPALATRRLTGPRALAVGYALGATGYAVGLAASAVFDLPSGPATVLMLAGFSAVTGLVAGRLARQ